MDPGSFELRGNQFTLTPFTTILYGFLNHHLPGLGPHRHTIRVNIHAMGKFFENDTRSGNHASIYLLTTDGKSVTLNMIKARATDKTAIPDLTVQRFLALVEKNKRHKYTLARSGFGCWFWVQTFISDFNYAQFIASSSPATAGAFCHRLRE
ncbi:hypothetical protein BKA65DRAFT_551222 [Rhexocercosporidium sp. MPI-PUGE-AT-0058]|nr:hypothetical protein BKA65DRAFT_551222 [Rhexocercosporidium sp. MPI-PUGE-AT-0058]